MSGVGCVLPRWRGVPVPHCAGPAASLSGCFDLHGLHPHGSVPDATARPHPCRAALPAHSCHSHDKPQQEMGTGRMLQLCTLRVFYWHCFSCIFLTAARSVCSGPTGITERSGARQPSAEALTWDHTDSTTKIWSIEDGMDLRPVFNIYGTYLVVATVINLLSCVAALTGTTTLKGRVWKGYKALFISHHLSIAPRPSSGLESLAGRGRKECISHSHTHLLGWLRSPQTGGKQRYQ